ncbi:hypothetical protein MHYP_G00266250 [Metynnis hypsauchen]
MRSTRGWGLIRLSKSVSDTTPCIYDLFKKAHRLCQTFSLKKSDSCFLRIALFPALKSYTMSYLAPVFETGGQGGSTFNFNGIDCGATLEKMGVWAGGPSRFGSPMASPCSMESPVMGLTLNIDLNQENKSPLFHCG